MTDGFFKNCDRPLDGPNEERDPALQGSVASVVVVTPIRNQNGKANYTQQVDNLYKMMLSVNNFADYFRNIQFHRVPFLTIDILELLIPEMRNLKVLGVYKCQLIHIGNTMKLLELIKKSKLVEYENQVSLDFFPNYHIGPIIVPGNPGTVGSYGVAWDSHDALDTCLGIWALVSQIIPQAKKQGIDFISKHTAFRQWLDKSPCWRVEETLNTTFNHKGPMDDDHFTKIAALVDCRNPSHYGKLRKFMDDKDDKRPEKWFWYVYFLYFLCSNFFALQKTRFHKSNCPFLDSFLSTTRICPSHSHTHPQTQRKLTTLSTGRSKNASAQHVIASNAKYFSTTRNYTTTPSTLDQASTPTPQNASAASWPIS